MNKILPILAFVCISVFSNAQNEGELIICENPCPANVNGEFSTGVIPMCPTQANLPTIYQCEPVDLCITIQCPTSINPGSLGLGSVNTNINLSSIQFLGFTGFPEGIDYCISAEYLTPGEYYTLHMTGTPTEFGTFDIKVKAVISATLISINTNTFYPDGVQAISVTIQPTREPVADFTVNTTPSNNGILASFTDASTNSPETWSWTFENGNPSTSTVQNPQVTFPAAGTYNVSLTVNKCGLSDTKSSQIQIGTTNLEDIDQNTIKLYPNPANDILNIEAENMKSINIFDITGKLVYSQEKCNSIESIDVSLWSKSSYIVKISTDKKDITKNFIIK